MYKKQLRVAVIVDNPFRDLEGAALVAREIVKRGGEACLIPMYEQAYDIPSFRPNVVIANYVRANNKSLLARYRSMGAAVVILDTEGNGGEDPHSYADSVLVEQPELYVDAYCLWGQDQYEAFLYRKVLKHSALVITGSPRYDLFSSKWQQYRSPHSPALKNYVLINTNFPIVNPRFDKDTDSVVRSWTRAGISKKFALDYAKDAIQLHQKYIEVVKEIIVKYPHCQFVLRPHPFEKIESYQYLQDFSNCSVIQSGTSLDWVRSCSVLLHLNCATSIEAVMLKRDVISFEWLNTPVARQKVPSEVSRQASSMLDLCEKLENALSGRNIPASEHIMKARQKFINRRYVLDGQSAIRITDLCMHLGQKHAWGKRQSKVRWSLKESVRRVMGYKGFTWLQEKTGGIGHTQRVGKSFNQEQIFSIISRLNDASQEVVKCNLKQQDSILNWLVSGSSIIVSAN